MKQVVPSHPCIKKQSKMNAYATQLHFSTYIVQDPSLGSGAAYSEWVWPPYLNQGNAPKPFSEGQLPGNSRVCQVNKTATERKFEFFGVGEGDHN